MYKRPQRKKKYQNMDNTKIGIKRGNSYWKNEKVSGWKTQISQKSMHSLNWYVSTLGTIFTAC